MISKWSAMPMAVCATLLPLQSIAQEVPLPAAQATALGGQGDLPICKTGVVPALTPVYLETLETVGSRTSKAGQWFDLRLAAPVVLEGCIAIPAGVIARAEVTDVHHATSNGTGGEFLAVARFLTVDGRKIRLRSLTMRGNGKDTPVRDMARCVFSSCSYTIYDIEYPAGSISAAKLAEPFDLSPVPATNPSQGN